MSMRTDLENEERNHLYSSGFRHSFVPNSLSELKSNFARNGSLNKKLERRSEPMRTPQNGNDFRSAKQMKNSVPIVSLVPIEIPIPQFGELKICDGKHLPSRTFLQSQPERKSFGSTTISQRNPQRRSEFFEKNFCSTENQDKKMKIIELMNNISRRLTKNLDLSRENFPLVDTHCHFDLIFSRLQIRHNDLTKYFQDFREFYPPKFDFQLAIQIRWLSQYLIQYLVDFLPSFKVSHSRGNWERIFSRYLNDHRVYGSCGVHPHWSSLWNDKTSFDLERCLKNEKIIALGEIGLDFGRKNQCDLNVQRRAFEDQLDLAVKYGKPLVIHARDAYKESFDLMKKHLKSNHKIHLHCFVGNLDDVDMFTSYFSEIKFGFTPIISRSNFLDPVLRQLELTQILSETDSPYFSPPEFAELSPLAHPGMVYSVIEKISQLRQTPIIDVALQIRENARRVYGV